MVKLKYAISLFFLLLSASIWADHSASQPSRPTRQESVNELALTLDSKEIEELILKLDEVNLTLKDGKSEEKTGEAPADSARPYPVQR